MVTKLLRSDLKEVCYVAFNVKSLLKERFAVFVFWDMAVQLYVNGVAMYYDHYYCLSQGRCRYDNRDL